MKKKIKKMEMFATKKCFDKCPQCGAKIDDEMVKVGKVEFDQAPYQNFECTLCGCEFQESYKYDFTMKSGQNEVK